MDRISGEIAHGRQDIILKLFEKDQFFAELAEIKLAEANIGLWRDQGQLRAGSDWRQGIEVGISSSNAALVALSKSSAESSYVTYEWAYALGKGKTIIPAKLEECHIHPRLENIQHLDFSIPNSLPWQSLIEQINNVEIDKENILSNVEIILSEIQDPMVGKILSYLNQHGYQMASFERLREKLKKNISDEDFKNMIKDNSLVFRRAKIKGDKPGLAKLIP